MKENELGRVKTESRRVVASDWGRGNGEMLINGYKVSVTGR